MVLNKFDNNKTILVAGLSAAIVFILLFFFWIFYRPANDLIINNPGMDKLNAGSDTLKKQNVKIGEFFTRNTEFTSALTGKWTRFRGEDFSNVVKTNIKINENWEKNPPGLVWKAETGEGHAAAVIYDGLVYFLDYNEKDRADVLRCISLTDGKEIWKRWYNVRMKRNHGMSRTIPAVNDKYIVTIGPKCHVMCLDRLTGNLLWTMDLEKQYGTEIPFWYTGQCPLIDDNVAILAPGGKAIMIGVDCASGKVLWETPNPDNLKMSHSSVIPMLLAGKRMYVYSALGANVGISAEPADAGKLLWSFKDWSPSVIAPSPLFIGNNKILFTAGYGAGSSVIQIAKKGNEFEAKELQRITPSQGIASEQQTPILYNNLIYCIQPKDAGALRNQLVCFNPDDCTKASATSGKTNRYGLGPYILINDKVLILNDEGTLALGKFSGSKFVKITEKRMFEGVDSWGPFAFADGYIIMRDSKNVYCFSLKE